VVASKQEIFRGFVLNEFISGARDMPNISLGFVNPCNDGGGIQITIFCHYHRLFPFFSRL